MAPTRVPRSPACSPSGVIKSAASWALPQTQGQIPRVGCTKGRFRIKPPAVGTQPTFAGPRGQDGAPSAAAPLYLASILLALGKARTEHVVLYGFELEVRLSIFAVEQVALGRVNDGHSEFLEDPRVGQPVWGAGEAACSLVDRLKQDPVALGSSVCPSPDFFCV